MITLRQFVPALAMLFVYLQDVTAQPILDTKFVGAPKRADLTNAQNLSRLTIASDGTMIVQATNGIYRSTNKGSTWTIIAEGMGVDFTFGIDSTLYLATETGVLASTNFGATWLDLSDQLPNGPFTSIVQTPAGTLIAGSTSGLFASTDLGANWDHVAVEEIKPFGTPWLTVTPKGTILARSISSYFRSTDEGRTWTATVPLTQRIFAVDENNILRQGNTGIERSTDDGLSWQKIPNTQSQYPFEIAVDGSGRLNRFIGYQIVTSTDGGTTWVATNTITGGGTTLAYAPDNTIYYGTSTQGVWRTLKPLSVESQENEPMSCSLGWLAFEAAIQLDLSRPSFINLSITDVQGIPRFEFQGSFQQGRTIVPIDRLLLGPGTYFCHLEGQGSAKNLKFIVY